MQTLHQVAPGLSYRPGEGSYDEMMRADGSLRPGWDTFLQALEKLGGSQLEQRWEQVRQLIRENGVTFNVYGAEDGMDRPWKLDPFPMILDAAEWARIEAGLKQRARLLELVLEDVYGSQICLKEGWLPADLVYGHPGYLRPCHGLPIPPECRLLLHAVDLARTATGELTVLRDRAEAPAGCGYALENRLAVARMVPELMRSTQVERLSSFFGAMRNTLAEMAERVFATPRVVFLTPGPANQTFFEHAYLAQYLGYSLVQGDDLTVRDNRVYLKLLEGLQPVDVILRRLRDNFCDPLELRTDSVIGIPGLVQAVRAGNVVVANCLGSGWLESPALHAFLPRLCRKLLDEELAIPGVPTWWCGDPRSLEQVLARLDEMVIKPAFPSSPGSAVFLGNASSKVRKAWRAELLRNPCGFVAQSQLELSTAPTLNGKLLEPRRIIMRAFLTRESDDFVVMPGALTLVSQEESSMMATLQRGAGSKDTWIIAPSKDGVLPSVITPERPHIELSRGGGDIPSRSADNLYWLGRYLERAEGLARLLRCCIVRLDEQGRPGSPLETPILLDLAGDPRSLRGAVDRAACRTRILERIGDGKEPGGVRQISEHLQRLSGTVRDRLSNEGWRLLNHLFEVSKREPKTLREAQALLEEMVMGFSSFSGLVTENMTRSHSWRFLEMGRRLERAVTMVGLLRRTVCSELPFEDAVLEAILEVADATRTYRRRYPAGLQIAPVLDLLLADESNPRSVAYQLNLLEFHFQHLPGRSHLSLPTPEERLLLSCVSRVKLAEIHDLVIVAEGRRRPALVNLLRVLGRELPLLSDLLVRKYLSHLTIKSQSPGFGREALP
jgi:uncharacterized circularly permuted ATP-grasp superfamily protein/uncharacterized alpha-E superfamily protein